MIHFCRTRNVQAKTSSFNLIRKRRCLVHQFDHFGLIEFYIAAIIIIIAVGKLRGNPISGVSPALFTFDVFDFH